MLVGSFSLFAMSIATFRLAREAEEAKLKAAEEAKEVKPVEVAEPPIKTSVKASTPSPEKAEEKPVAAPATMKTVKTRATTQK
jgi:hypothetical protein